MASTILHTYPIADLSYYSVLLSSGLGLGLGASRFSNSIWPVEMAVEVLAWLSVCNKM